MTDIRPDGGLAFTPNDGKNYVGNYVVEKTLGEGAFGKVKLGRHVLTGEKVALKILEKNRIKGETDRKRVEREIKIMRLLDHPSIIKLYDVIDCPTQIYLVLEYADGGELFDYIVARGRVKEREARKFFRQLVAGVAYCHRLNIIHRDLKPENLLLDSDKNIRIIDFGFSNTMQRGTLLKTFCGSPAYAAPEMVSGHEYTGPEVDVWSLGVILFALLCGYLPFDHKNLPTLYKQILRGEYHCPSFVSPGARHLISRMLTGPPHKRATLHEVSLHPWMNEGYDAPIEMPPAFDKVTTEDQLDEEVLSEMATLGFEADTCRAMLLEGRESKLTAAYHLLLNRKKEAAAKATAATPREQLVAAQAANSSEKAAEKTAGGPPAPPRRPRNRATPATMAMPAIGEGKPAEIPSESENTTSGSDDPMAQQVGRRKPPTHLVVERRHSIATASSSNRRKVPAPLDVSDLAPGVGASASLNKPKTPITPITPTMSSAAAGGPTKPPPAMSSDSSGDDLDDQDPDDVHDDAASAAAAAVVAGRKKRRFSLDAAMSSLSNMLGRGKKGDDNGPRTVKFTSSFSKETTSTKSPEEMLSDALAGADSLGMIVNATGFLVEVVDGGVSFEMEIVRLKDMTTNGVILKRVTGDTWAYKDACTRLLNSMSL